jgi:hypothetical protein
MSWTLCTSGSAIRKAGVNANSAIISSGSALADWSDQAEGRIESECRRSWVANYSGLPASVKNALADTASSDIAKKIINYDMSGFTSRTEAQTMLNVLDDIFRQNIQVLKDFKSNEIKEP